VLARERIPIDVVSGTSMGAIIGGTYAAHRDVDTLERRVGDLLRSEEFRKNRLSFLKEIRREKGGLFFSMANLVRSGILLGVSRMRPSIVSAEDFATSLGSVVPHLQIEDLSPRFGAVALDIEAAEEVVLCHGDLRTATSASSAIPGMLPPVRLGGRRLVDGGWVDKIPVLPAFKMGADVVIGVDIGADLQDARDYRRGMDVMVRANSIKDSVLVRQSRRMADVMIDPDVGHVHWADFDAWQHCIAAGEAAAERSLPAIRKLLRRERWRSLVRAGRGKKMAELQLESDEIAFCID
jgi:NTE family protein